MKIKLRIPMFLLTLGVASGIIQIINYEYTLSKTQNYISTILFFLMVGGSALITERLGIGEKKVNVIIGLFLICIGIGTDLITRENLPAL